MKNWTKVIILSIFLLSFRFYSAIFYPILNSDNAVTILMIHYFKLPQDLYFWGQDRMGSIIPLVGQIFFKLFGFSALVTESITHYLILLAGYLAFSSFFKSNILKVIFAIIWFFPPFRLIEGIQLYFNIEYSLIAISCYLIYFHLFRIDKKNPLWHFTFITIILLLIFSVWVSDMAIITISILIAAQMISVLKSKIAIHELLRKTESYYILCGLIIGLTLILLAKSNSSVRNEYLKISSWTEIIDNYSIFGNSLVELFKFRAYENFTSIYSYLVVILIVIAAISFSKLYKLSIYKSLIFVFILDAFALFVIIMLMEWTHINEVPRRYFVCAYISLSFSILLIFDNFDLKKCHTRFILGTLFTTVIIGGSGSIYNMKYFWPGTLTPKVTIVKEFEQLGNIGIIGNYWNSYIISCVNPEKIKATPHEMTGAAVRNLKLVDEVFDQKRIFVIRDMWMETFPDTLTEFNRTLIRKNTEFRLGDCFVCEYTLFNTMNQKKNFIIQKSN